MSVAISTGVLNTSGFVPSVFPRMRAGSPRGRSKQLALLCTGQMPLMAKKFNMSGASHPKPKVQFCQH